MKQTEYIQPIILIEEIELAESFATNVETASIDPLKSLDPNDPGYVDPYNL